MSAQYPYNASWQQAQGSSPVMPPSPAPQPGMFWLPPVANDRTNFSLTGVCLMIGPFFFLPQGIANFVGSHAPFPVRVVALLYFYLLPALLITLGILALKQQRRWNVVNERRQMAAAWGFASRVPLAEPRPFPNAGALPPSFTIKHRINWLIVFVLVCLVVVLFFLVWADFALSTALSFGESLQEGLGDVLRIQPLPWVFLPTPLVLLARASWPQRIEITPEGLIVRHPGFDWARNGQASRQYMIRWHEARLFALREGKPGASIAHYELSSPITVITFRRILQPRWWSRFRPAQTFGEYNAQMDALLALISARTGLPLYDVRQTDESPRLERPTWARRLTNYSVTISAVLVGLSVAGQAEGIPGVLFAKANDGRPIVFFLEFIACLLAVVALWFGYRAPGNQTRLVGFGYVCVFLALFGLILFPFGPFLPLP